MTESMTESEAIERLNCLRLYMQITDKNSDSKFLDEDYEANAMAIKALEKQIPKKPEYEADGYADGELVYDYAKCPICGHDFEYGINDWGCEYCSDCGQKLDWESDEE